MKLTLLLSAISLAAFADSDSTALGQKFAKANAAKSEGQAAVVRNDNTEIRWVTVQNGRGGVTLRAERVPATNIALVKSSKGKCDDAACCAKH